MKGYVECLLQVMGDAAGLNTFDKLFRSGKGPSWADRASDGAPRYSLHALFPVPEAIQRRGYETAGHLWCGDFWDVPDDLVDMQVKRLWGKRYDRFYTPGGAPENVFLKASYDFPLLHLRLVGLGVDRGDLQNHFYHGGYYQGSFSPDGENPFAILREEMGFSA